jgi:transketolase
MRGAFVDALLAAAEADERVWLLTGDLGYNVLEGFAEKFPNRYVNMGIAEQNMIGVAAGIAMAGNIPFVYSLGNFPVMRCLEQIRNDVCYHDLPVRIVALGGGLTYGSLGYTHHSVEDLAVMKAMPNLKVIAPGDPFEAAAATTALASMSGPAYLRLGRAGERKVHASPPSFAIGKAILLRDGGDCTLIATGAVLALAADAAENLSAAGIDVRLISMHTLNPLDEKIIRDAVETEVVVTIEEHGPGGLASSVAEILVGSSVRFAPIRLKAGAQIVTDTQEGLRARQGLTVDGIIQTVQKLLSEK